MKSDSIAFGIAGVFFGLIAGWIIGSQQAGARPPAPVAQAASSGSPNASDLRLSQDTTDRTVCSRPE